MAIIINGLIRHFVMQCVTVVVGFVELLYRVSNANSDEAGE